MLSWKKLSVSRALAVQLVMQSDSLCETTAESKVVKQCLMQPVEDSSEYFVVSDSKNMALCLSGSEIA